MTFLVVRKTLSTYGEVFAFDRVQWQAMYSLILAWFFILGTVIGSFLNVVIYRLHTGKSVNGRSHCLSCGKRLSWSELIPILSYLAQWARCRGCGARITVGYVAVELLTGALFLLIAQTFLFDPILLLLNLGVASVLVVIVVYDMRHTIIPDELVLYLSVLAVAYALWDPLSQSVTLPSGGALLGGLIPVAFLGGLWFISRGRWLGLGDAKLVFPLGLIVGAWGSVSLLMLAFWIGAVVSVGLLAFQRIPMRGLPFLRKHLTMQSEVPFAPFLICAFFLVQLMGIDVFAVLGAAFRW